MDKLAQEKQKEKRVNLFIDPSVKEAGKILAVKRKMSFSKLVEELIQKATSEE